MSRVRDLCEMVRDFPRFAANNWRIDAKSRAKIPFKLNRAQRAVYGAIKKEFDGGKPIRLRILKFRQAG